MKPKYATIPVKDEAGKIIGRVLDYKVIGGCLIAEAVVDGLNVTMQIPLVEE